MPPSSRTKKQDTNPDQELFLAKRSAVQETTWEEIGFAEFPIVTTSLKRPPFDTLEYIERVGTDDAGEPIHRTWQVVSSSEYGLPRLPDLDIFIAILKLLEVHNYEKKLVMCTVHQICEAVGLTPGGTTYQRIKSAFIRFQTTSYLAKNVFTDKETDTRILSEGWDIITDHRLLPDTQSKAVRDGLPPSYFAVSAPFLNRLRKGQPKPIDLGLWRELPLGLEKPIYHYVDKNFHGGKDRHEIGLNKFGKRIGVTGKYNRAQLKRLYKKPLTNLVKVGFLAEYCFEPSKNPADPEKVVLFPGPRARSKRRSTKPDPRYQKSGQRPAEGQISPHTALAARFRQARYGEENANPSASQARAAKKLLAACNGNLEIAELAVDFAGQLGREAGPEGFPNHIAGVLEGNFISQARERHARWLEQKKEAERRAEYEKHFKVYEAAMQERADARLAALDQAGRERIVDDRLPAFLKAYDHYVRRQNWTKERARQWAAPRILEEYAREDEPAYFAWRQEHHGDN